MNIQFCQKADKYMPQLYKTELSHASAVGFAEDKKCWQDTKVVCDTCKEFYAKGGHICLDFGRHITGFFEFMLGQYDEYIDAQI